MATNKRSSSKEPQNKPASVAPEAEDVTNDQEKATLPADERGDAELDVGETGASDAANERFEKAGGLAMSDESGIENQDPKADGESETPQLDGEDEADAPEDPNEEAETQSAEQFDPQIKPDFFSLDEKALNRWLTGFKKDLRQRGMIVNGPDDLEAQQDAGNMPASISGEGSTRSLPAGSEHVVYESKLQWRRQDGGDPITVAETSLQSALEARRSMAQTAYVRRLEI